MLFGHAWTMQATPELLSSLNPRTQTKRTALASNNTPWRTKPRTAWSNVTGKGTVSNGPSLLPAVWQAHILRVAHYVNQYCASTQRSGRPLSHTIEHVQIASVILYAH